MDSTAEGANQQRRLGGGYHRLFGASTISNLGDGIGSLAYPWLASAITRNPLLIAIVVIVQRLPWLVFSLPAGVVADRYDRAKVMVRANLARAGITTAVAVAVLTRQGSLPGPDELDQGQAAVTDTDVGLYLVLIAATLLLGIGEVLYDTSAQTFLPRLVATDQLEKANGRLWSAEQVANAFVGPPLGAFLLLGVFAVPFFVDAVTFTVSAALIATIGSAAAPQTFADRSVDPGNGSDGATATRSSSWRAEIGEGFRWLWHNDFLRSLAITLGLFNMLGTLSTASLILFAQEELGTSPGEFAAMTIVGAIGAVVGGWTASGISSRLGQGPSLWAALIGASITSIVIGFSSAWPVVAVMFSIALLLATVWNVITVSLRQTIIPDELLGRVNSVYRFFGWGMMPIGALLGGVIMVTVEAVADRSLALRVPWFVTGLGELALLAWAGPKLTSPRIDRARREAEGG